jgi:hypothetical protein
MIPWRLGDSHFSINNIESGNGYRWNRNIAYFYGLVSYVSLDLAYYYYDLFLQTWNFQYYDLFLFYLRIAVSFHIGYNSLVYYQELDWAYYMTNSLFTYNGNLYEWTNDGILAYPTQVYMSYIPVDKRIVALHCNHLELLNNYYGREAIKTSFLKPDIGIQRR